MDGNAEKVFHLVIGGPGLWAPLNMFYNLKEADMFPVSFKPFDAVCNAALLRTSIKLYEFWHSGAKMIEEGGLVHPGMWEDSNMLHPLQEVLPTVSCPQ